MVRNSSIKLLCLLTICVYVTIVLNACNKKLFDSSVNNAGVKIRLKGASYNLGDLNKNSSKNSSNIDSDTIEPQHIKIVKKGFTVQGTLTAVGANSLFPKNDLRKNKVAATVVLDLNTAYRVVIYNVDGSYVKHQDFIYGDEATIPDLDGGKAYIFVAYSVNTPNISDLPALNTSENFNNVTITVNNDRDFLMYDIKHLTVHYGQDNNLDLVLDHKFSQITTTVSINNNAYNNGARIKSIALPTIDSQRESATLKLSDGSLTYGTVDVEKKELTGDEIPDIGVQSYTFDPLNIISDDIDNATMNFPSFTISTGSTVGAIIDMKNENFSISNLKITPGYRYNLNLNIVMPCVEKVEPTMLYEVEGPFGYGIEVDYDEIEFSSSDFGVEINIFKLDQSFQFIVNGEPIFVREAEFDSDGINGYDMDDVRFKFGEGRYYFDTYGNSIYDLIGDETEEKPIVKLIIDYKGFVSMYGSRVSASDGGYELEPLILVNDNGFNKVTWSDVNTNTVVLRQTSYGTTNISFNVVGYKKIVCP